MTRGSDGRVVLRPPLDRRLAPVLIGCLLALVTVLSLAQGGGGGSPIDGAYVMGLVSALLLLVWWQLRTRVEIDPDGLSVHGVGLARRLRRDDVVAVSRWWGLVIETFRPALGRGVGLSILGTGGRGRPMTVHLDPRSSGFDEAVDLVASWARADPAMVRDPLVAEGFGLDIPHALTGADGSPSQRIVVCGALPRERPFDFPWWVFALGTPWWTTVALDDTQHAVARVLSAGLVVCFVVSALARWADSRVVRRDSVTHGLRRRRLALSDIDSISVAAGSPDAGHPATVPIVTVTGRTDVAKTPITLSTSSRFAELALRLDAWVAARPEIVRDEVTEAWFADRGVLPRDEHVAQGQP